MIHALSINNLRKTYANGVTALQGISLDVEEGDFFALLGPNGAGKSTTIGIVSSLVNKSSGTVKIFGHDLDTALNAAKANLGLVPQEFNCNIFQPCLQTLINQAGYYGVPRKKALARSEEYLVKLGLWEKRHARARELSGGQKRRLMIARAMVHQPKLLILDEPTAGVDIEIRRSMWQFFREINRRGTTLILTTHYLEEAESLCKNIAIINHGEIIENTSMRHLLGQLDTETFIFYLVDSIEQAPQVEGYAIHRVDGKTLEVEVSRDRPLNALFTALSAHKIEIASMRNKVNRLEELFINLTQAKTHA